jgi:hypothetical protein
MKKWEE